MNYRNWFSKERITNNDDFCFKSPITRPDHFRLVLTPRFHKYVSQKPTNVNMWQFIKPCRAIKKTQKFKLQLCVLVEQTYILYKILKNETDISTFVKHMTEEEFRMISHQ